MNLRNFSFTGLICVVSMALSACNPGTTNSNGIQSGAVVSSGSAQIGGPFTLVNQDGKTVTEQSLIGQPHLIYFGFTFCPDVCPTALQQLGLALERVDPQGTYFQPVFISVDPERDTPEQVKLYVTANGFPPNLIGLTGTVEQVEVAKRAYKVFSQKVEDPNSSAPYTVDHVSLIFLMDEDGKFADVFTHSTSVADMVNKLNAFQQNAK